MRNARPHKNLAVRCGGALTWWEKVNEPDDARSRDAVREQLEALVRHLEEPVRVRHDAVAVDDEQGQAPSVPITRHARMRPSVYLTRAYKHCARGANGAPADDVLRVIGGAEDALEEVVGLDFQERVVRVDAVGTESLQHELALAPELVPVRREPDL